MQATMMEKLIETIVGAIEDKKGKTLKINNEFKDNTLFACILMEKTKVYYIVIFQYQRNNRKVHLGFYEV